MNELFTLPLLGAFIALPRAYWEPSQPKYTSHFMVLIHSETSFRHIQTIIAKNETEIYDMDIINTAFGASCMVLPHRPYALLTGEFFHDNEEHVNYLGNKEEE